MDEIYVYCYKIKGNPFTLAKNKNSLIKPESVKILDEFIKELKVLGNSNETDTYKELAIRGLMFLLPGFMILSKGWYQDSLVGFILLMICPLMIILGIVFIFVYFISKNNLIKRALQIKENYQVKLIRHYAILSFVDSSTFEIGNDNTKKSVAFKLVPVGDAPNAGGQQLTVNTNLDQQLNQTGPIPNDLTTPLNSNQ